MSGSDPMVEARVKQIDDEARALQQTLEELDGDTRSHYETTGSLVAEAPEQKIKDDRERINRRLEELLKERLGLRPGEGFFGGPEDGSLDTGHYDDGHAFGWKKAPEPEPEIPDTGHYDDGHSFGWGKAPEPQPEPEILDTGHYDDGHAFGWGKAPETEMAPKTTPDPAAEVEPPATIAEVPADADPKQPHRKAPPKGDPTPPPDNVWNPTPPAPDNVWDPTPPDRPIPDEPLPDRPPALPKPAATPPDLAALVRLAIDLLLHRRWAQAVIGVGAVIGAGVGLQLGGQAAPAAGPGQSSVPATLAQPKTFDACKLVSDEEAGQILNRGITATGEPGSHQCRYEATPAATFTVSPADGSPTEKITIRSVTVTADTGAAAGELYASQGTAKLGKDPVHEDETITSIGDRAVFTNDGGLVVQLGSRAVDVNSDSDRDNFTKSGSGFDPNVHNRYVGILEDFARLALPRVPASQGGNATTPVQVPASTPVAPSNPLGNGLAGAVLGGLLGAAGATAVEDRRRRQAGGEIFVDQPTLPKNEVFKPSEETLDQLRHPHTVEREGTGAPAITDGFVQPPPPVGTGPEFEINVLGAAPGSGGRQMVQKQADKTTAHRTPNKGLRDLYEALDDVNQKITAVEGGQAGTVAPSNNPLTKAYEFWAQTNFSGVDEKEQLYRIRENIYKLINLYQTQGAHAVNNEIYQQKLDYMFKTVETEVDIGMGVAETEALNIGAKHIESTLGGPEPTVPRPKPKKKPELNKGGVHDALPQGETLHGNETVNVPREGPPPSETPTMHSEDFTQTKEYGAGKTPRKITDPLTTPEDLAIRDGISIEVRERNFQKLQGQGMSQAEAAHYGEIRNRDINSLRNADEDFWKSLDPQTREYLRNMIK